MNKSKIIVLNNLSGVVYSLYKYYVFTFVLYNQGVMHFPPPKASFSHKKKINILQLTGKWLCEFLPY